MSKKRSSEEYNDDGQTSEASADLVQQDAKRANLVPWSETTLQDLPIELLEDILIKTVVMEVKDMKLAKCAWKEKADLVISRLQTVCQQWSNILTTNYFRNKVHAVLDGTAQKKFRLEILHQSTLQSVVKSVATMHDEMFMLCRPYNKEPYTIVHDRNNMVEMKAIIPLPGIVPVDIVACGVSNCLYILNLNSISPSILRIATDEAHQYNISTWVNELCVPFFTRLFPGLNGRLIILSRTDNQVPSVVSIYNVDGSLHHSITLFPDFDYIFSVIEKSNGNLILATYHNIDDRDLREIDASGRIVQIYRSKFDAYGVSVADNDERIWICGLDDEMELLDSELNILDLTDTQQDTDLFLAPVETHYNSERNEIVCISMDAHALNLPPILTIFRYTES